MDRVRFQGTWYEVPDPDDWTTGEVSEAEHALGHRLSEESTADAMAVAFYIAVRRGDKEIPPVLLADSVRQIKFSDYEKDLPDAADPLEPPAAQPTSGPRLSAASG